MAKNTSLNMFLYHKRLRENVMKIKKDSVLDCLHSSNSAPLKDAKIRNHKLWV